MRKVRRENLSVLCTCNNLLIDTEFTPLCRREAVYKVSTADCTRNTEAKRQSDLTYDNFNLMFRA